MERSVSGMMGKGSAAHNSRKFNAKNTDKERTCLNVEYCNENIKDVYHELFDEALRRYNAKQTRKDRIIDDYYEHIRCSKQEKPFKEIIMQVGNKDDMGFGTGFENLAKEILDEYYRGFVKRNPNLRVFSAHIHMDEATPHIHIDFIPFITGSKRGLDTRVSLKKALAEEGFPGGAKGDTEWVQWMSSEKCQLVIAMEHHGVRYVSMDDHEKHKDVTTFKRDQLREEIKELESKIETKEEKIQYLEDKVENLMDAEREIGEINAAFEEQEEYKLPQPERLMSARTYKAQYADPVISNLKELVRKVLKKFYELKDKVTALEQKVLNLRRENGSLKNENETLREENNRLYNKLSDYKALCREFGWGNIESLIDEALSRRWEKELERNEHSR